MPTATAKAAAPTEKVQTTTITKKTTEPVERPITEPAAPAPEPREDFWRYIESLTEEDWKDHHVTLYRYPLGQPKPHKLGRYIKTYKFGSPLLSEDQIFEEFGGSQYDAILKGPGKDGTRFALIARHAWEMDGPAKNPWQVSTSTTQTPPPSDTTAVLEMLLKHVQSLQTSKNPAQDPALKESIGLIQQLTAAMPKPEGVKELVAGLASLQQLTGGGGGEKSSILETITILKELGVIGEKRRTIAEELKDLLEVTAMLGGGGGGGKTDWATSLVQNLPTIIEKAQPIADKFAEASRNNARVAEIRAGRVPAPAPPNTRAQPALVPSATSPAAAAPAAESPAARTVAPPETEPATPAASPYIAPNLEWVKARAVQLFAAGKTGDAIAEWLDSLDEQLGNFLGAMDAEKFAAFVKGDPILGQIATAPRFHKFVEEFVDYFTEELEPPGEPVTTH